MLKLRKKHVVPPGGYRYYDPDLKMKVEKNTLQQLIEEITRLRGLNALEIPDNLADIIENWICEQVPDNFVIGDLTKKPKLGYVPVATVRVATEKFLTKWRATGRKVCSQQEAVRRAAICVQCQENNTNSSCLEEDAV